MAGAEILPDLGDEQFDLDAELFLVGEPPIEEVCVLNQPRRWIRRTMGAVALVGALAGGMETIPGVPGHTQAALLGRLVEADVHASGANQPTQPTYDNLIKNYSVGNGLFRKNSSPFAIEYATVWPVSRVLDAEYIHALQTGDPQIYKQFQTNLNATVETYLEKPSPSLPPTYDQGPTVLHFKSDPPLVDDAQWMARLNMLDYERTHDPTQLHIAKDVFTVAMSQWNPNGGGIFWQVQLPSANNHICAMVSNATVARLGYELYAQTKDPSYLQASEKIDAWVRQTLRLGDGNYADHIDPDGFIDSSEFTYNFALQPLEEAESTAPGAVQNAADQLSNAMEYFRARHLAGAPAFDSIFAESALYVASRYDHPIFTAQIRQFIGDAIAAEPKNPTDLLPFASEVVLHELQRLPVDKYQYLFAG